MYDSYDPNVIYFVECDYGRLGKAWAERDSNSNEQSLINDIIYGQLDTKIIRILRVNPVKGSSFDVTKIIGEYLFYHYNIQQTPFTKAPEVARDLMMRAGKNLDAIDAQNEECDNVFSLNKMEPL